MTPLAVPGTVLIVDDEPAVRDLMAHWTASLGLRSATAANAAQALTSATVDRFDLAILDVLMPGHDGLWLAAELHRRQPDTAVVLTTAYTELLDRDGHRPPIADLLVKPFQRDRFTLAVERGRRWHKAVAADRQWHARLTRELEERVTDIIGRIRADAAPGCQEPMLVALMRERAIDVVRHSERVAAHAVAAARELGLDHAAVETIRLAARFHDVGKAAMPEALLTKPSPLTADELSVMQSHPAIGADILASTLDLASVADVVRASHEWFDGGGYPQQLAGEAIPLAARVVSVVDSYDAMTGDRSYRASIGTRQAVEELLRCSGTQFDPDVVAAFLACLGRTSAS